MAVAPVIKIISFLFLFLYTFFWLLHSAREKNKISHKCNFLQVVPARVFVKFKLTTGKINGAFHICNTVQFSQQMFLHLLKHLLLKYLCFLGFFRLQEFFQAERPSEPDLHLSREPELSDRPAPPEPVSALPAEKVPQDGNATRRYSIFS